MNVWVGVAMLFPLLSLLAVFAYAFGDEDVSPPKAEQDRDPLDDMTWEWPR